jgi:phosphoribosylglycinamide formyltransferase-1
MGSKTNDRIPGFQTPTRMADPTRLVVLISGTGTTLHNLIQCIARGELPARIVGVIASRSGIGGIARAEEAGIPVAIVPPGQKLSEQIFATVERFQGELVVLAGWLHLLTIPEPWLGRVVNIHPSLLPAFGGRGMYGLRVHQAVLHYGAKVSGCTVHFADNQYDSGPIILQAVVPVEDDDTPESLAARVFAQECEIYPRAIRLWCENRLRIEGRRVRILPANPSAQG